MILNLIQKQTLIKNVEDMLNSYGENQEKGEFIEVIDRTKAYSVETNGKMIILYDYKDPDVFIFDSIKEFAEFIMKEF